MVLPLTGFNGFYQVYRSLNVFFDGLAPNFTGFYWIPLGFYPTVVVYAIFYQIMAAS